MAEYRTITVGADVSKHTVKAGANLSKHWFKANAKISTETHSSDLPPYEGAYVVVPDWEAQTLPTKNTQLNDDITVTAIQLESVSNLSGGRTVYIGGII